MAYMNNKNVIFEGELLVTHFSHIKVVDLPWHMDASGTKGVNAPAWRWVMEANRTSEVHVDHQSSCYRRTKSGQTIYFASLYA